MDGDRRHP